jgi:hypothetical protein
VVLAWFTKAAAAFFVAAVLFDACLTILLARWTPLRQRFGFEAPSPYAARAAAWTLAGVALAGVAALVLFVAPNWREYEFYNWQMSVTRKPAYTIRALMDRASWIPIVHDFFTRMWLVTAVAMLAVASTILRIRSARPAERVLLLWVLLGFAELVIHDSGNERRSFRRWWRCSRCSSRARSRYRWKAWRRAGGSGG